VITSSNNDHRWFLSHHQPNYVGFIIFSHEYPSSTWPVVRPAHAGICDHGPWRPSAMAKWRPPCDRLFLRCGRHGVRATSQYHKSRSFFAKDRHTTAYNVVVTASMRLQNEHSATTSGFLQGFFMAKFSSIYGFLIMLCIVLLNRASALSEGSLVFI
jgi:hypothetical protein